MSFTDPADIKIKRDELADKYLGFSIIRDVKERCLGRTIIDPSKIGKNIEHDCFCLSTDFSANIGGARYSVCGYPYMSQDTDATVCAHSALWGVCRYLSQRFHFYKEVYPYDLIRMTGHMEGRVIPYRGMTYTDYSAILTEFGCYPIILRVNNSGLKDIERFKDLYTYVESGFPVLASLSGHVVSLIGHTIDKTKSTYPDKDNIVDSSSFIKQFVVIDDNIFPYALLGYPGDNGNYGDLFPNKFNIDSIHTGVCPLPEKAFLPAEKARLKAVMHYKKIFPEIIGLGHKPPWVVRLLLTTCVSFKKRKLKLYIDNNNDRIAYFVTEMNLPHFIWLMELYTKDSYNNDQCIAEVVLDATAGNKEDGTLYMRVGNQLYFDDKKNTIEDVPVFFPQYTHNLGERTS
jgi:hypothetical protein